MCPIETDSPDYTLLIIKIAFRVVFFILGVWVFYDAKSRGLNPVLSFIFGSMTFWLGILAFVFWIILRPQRYNI